jgi:hypothetical protein
MIETAVIFETEKVGSNGWQIRCVCPDGKIERVTGFLDARSIENWLASDHRRHWLKVRGYQES